MNSKNIFFLFLFSTAFLHAQGPDPMLDIDYLFSDSLSLSKGLGIEKITDEYLTNKEFLRNREHFESEISRLNNELARLRNRIILLEEGRKDSENLLQVDILSDQYSKALQYYNDGAYEKAGTLFSQIMAETHDTILRLNSMFWASECAFRLGNYNRSVILLNEIIHHQAFSKLEDGYILLAASYERLDRDHEAKKFYLAYSRDYPDGRYARLAKKKLGSND